MKGPGAAQPCNNAPFHSLSDTHTRSSMSDPPQLPPDLIWGAVPLSPAYAPTDVFIITLSFYLWWLGEETGRKGWWLGVRRMGRELGQRLTSLSLRRSPVFLLLSCPTPLPLQPPEQLLWPSLSSLILKGDCLFVAPQVSAFGNGHSLWVARFWGRKRNGARYTEMSENNQGGQRDFAGAPKMGIKKP